MAQLQQLVHSVVHLASKYDRELVGAVYTLLVLLAVAIGRFVVRGSADLLQRAHIRLSRRKASGTYLNWVVLQNQELSLAGIIGAGEKPKLEDVFIPLELEKPQAPKGADGAVEKAAQPARLRLLRLLRLSAPPPPADTAGSGAGRMPLFSPGRYWRASQLLLREDLLGLLWLVAALTVLLLLPAYGLFIAPPDANAIVATGAMVWSLVLLVGLATLVVSGSTPAARRAGAALAAIPALLLAAGTYAFVCRAERFPVAIATGLLPALAGTVLMAWRPTSLIATLVRLVVSRKLGVPFGANQPQAEGLGEVISSCDCVAVLGGPGAGKSTYVQFLALAFARQRAGERALRRQTPRGRHTGLRQWLLPIVIPLRQVSRAVAEGMPGSTGNFLIEAFRQKVLPSDIRETIPLSSIEHMLHRRQCMLLLDGLDEVATDDELRAVVREIEGLVSRFPGNKIIITSRQTGWRGGLDTLFRVVTLKELDDAQIGRFVQSWYRAATRGGAAGARTKADRLHRDAQGKRYADALVSSIRRTEQLRTLAGVPLLLSMLCYVHYSESLPEERLSLYQDCSRLMLLQWDREKGLQVDDTGLTLVRKEAILGEIAFALHSGRIGGQLGGEEAPRKEIVDVMAAALGRFGADPAEADHLLVKLIARSGLVVAGGSSGESCGFSHLSFQEFYAAWHMHASGIDPMTAVSASSGGSLDRIVGWWREPILLYCSMVPDCSHFVRRLLDTEEDDPPKRLLRLAAQCLLEAASGASDRALEVRVLRRLYELRTQGRSAANEALAMPEVRRYLLRFALSPAFYESVFLEAVNSVNSANGAERAASGLLSQLADSDSDIRQACAKALSRLRARWGALLASGPDPDIALPASLDLLKQGLLMQHAPGIVPDHVKTTLLIVGLAMTQALCAVGVMDAIMWIKTRVEPYDPLEFVMWQCSVPVANALLADALAAASADERATIRECLVRAIQAAVRSPYQAILVSLLLPHAPYMCQGIDFGDPVYASDMTLTSLTSVLLETEGCQEQQAHMCQLREMLWKGRPHQRALAILLLVQSARRDSILTGTIVARLESPSSIVRLAAIWAIARLELDGDQLVSVERSLRAALVQRRWRERLVLSFWQALTGIGCLGATAAERVEVAKLLLLLAEPSDTGPPRALVQACAQCPHDRLWWALECLPAVVTDRLSDDDLVRVLRITDGRLTTPAPGPDVRELRVIFAIASRRSGPIRDVIVRVLFGVARDDGNDRARLALHYLEQLSVVVHRDSEEYRVLLEKLRSRAYATSDAAFAILHGSGLI